MNLEALKFSIDNLTKAIQYGNKQVYTKEEAADYLNIGMNAMTDIIKNGEISYKMNGRNYLFHREHLDEWLLSPDVVVMDAGRKKRRTV